jgi:hypothetical protein
MSNSKGIFIKSISAEITQGTTRFNEMKRNWHSLHFPQVDVFFRSHDRKNKSRKNSLRDCWKKICNSWFMLFLNLLFRFILRPLLRKRNFQEYILKLLLFSRRTVTVPVPTQFRLTHTHSKMMHTSVCVDVRRWAIKDFTWHVLSVELHKKTTKYNILCYLTLTKNLRIEFAWKWQG